MSVLKTINFHLIFMVSRRSVQESRIKLNLPNNIKSTEFISLTLKKVKYMKSHRDDQGPEIFNLCNVFLAKQSQ